NARHAYSSGLLAPLSSCQKNSVGSRCLEQVVHAGHEDGLNPHLVASVLRDHRSDTINFLHPGDVVVGRRVIVPRSFDPHGAILSANPDDPDLHGFSSASCWFKGLETTPRR